MKSNNNRKKLMNNYENECIICLEEFNENRNIVILDCNHKFHEKCINDWFCYNITTRKKDFYQYNGCPNCKLGTKIKNVLNSKKSKKKYKKMYRRISKDKVRKLCCCRIL